MNVPPFDSTLPVRVADICREGYPVLQAYYRGVVGELCVFSGVEGGYEFCDLWLLSAQPGVRSKRVARLSGPEAAALAAMLQAP